MCRSFGGEALIDATVRSIIIENGRAVGVRVSNTDELEEAADHPEKVPTVEIRAKNVVCGTSVYNLYKKLLPQGEKLANITCHFSSSRLLLEQLTNVCYLIIPDLPVVEKFNDSSKRTIRQSNGHVFLFCKIRGDPDEINLPKNNVWYFNGYDLDEAFDAYFTNPTEVRPPTVYIGFPCTKDTTWKKRFAGISNCIMISDGRLTLSPSCHFKICLLINLHIYMQDYMSGSKSGLTSLYGTEAKTTSSSRTS